MKGNSGRKWSDKRRVLGLMSGTSGDGIDAACVEILGSGTGMKVRFLWHHHSRFSTGLRRRVHAAMAPAANRTEDVATLHAELGEAFAGAACESIRSCARGQHPELIGLAGQTVCHLPGNRRRSTITLQLGEPARVARRTGLTTVAEFRQGDVAAGGQGAPLVPWTDWILLRDATRTRAIQNIGGVANVTFLPAGQSETHVTAFDTGPGNMVIDALADHYSHGRRRMDRGGATASRGTVHEALLAEWMKHPFFRRKPPKTTGREMFGRAYAKELFATCRRRRIREEDALATATALTARSIAKAYRTYLGWDDSSVQRESSQVGGDAPREIIVCGGGAKNRTLMRMLGECFKRTRVLSIDRMGIPVQAKEAVSFAVLAAARVDGIPANLPQVTGASGPARMGSIYLP